MHLSNEMLKDFFEIIAITHEKEMDCDEVFVVIDEFVELVTLGEDLSELMPLVQLHLQLCPACYEEFEALLRMVQAFSDGKTF